MPYHKGHDNQLRLLHYPRVPAEELEQEKIIRIDAHSDYASITLLLQDGVGGLEVEDPNHPGQFRVSATAADITVSLTYALDFHLFALR